MKKISKSLIFIISLVFVVGSSFSVFATSTDETAKSKIANAVKEKNTDIIIGKITSIDANNVTIEVATRRERTKNEKTEKNTTVNKTESGTERQKPNYEDRYVLTGETRTYNIASADLGKMPDTTKEVDNFKEKSVGISKTYNDYLVGDYIRITVNKDTNTIAKRIRNANQGSNVEGHYVGGYKGSYTGKTKAEKAIK